MALTINTNVPSLLAQLSLNSTQNKLDQTLNRLSSGLRINEAKDDAAGLAIAEGIKEQINGLRQGARNGNDGMSLLESAEGGMTQALSLLQRMRELASQASTGTYQTSDLANLNTEYQTLAAEINRENATVNFNNISLLAGGSVSIQVGANNTANDRLSISLTATDTTTLGINGNDLLTNANAQAALVTLQTAITTVTTGLAQLGADHSNLEAAVKENMDSMTRLEDAHSRIMDADFAEESSNLAKFQILQQSGIAMLSQANSSSQVVLKLLQ